MSYSAARVQRDLVEVLTNAIEGLVVYIPHEGVNVNHWVVRYACKDGPLTGLHFYFELRFSTSYPVTPPTLRSLTLLPHVAVDRTSFEVCLTMLSRVSSSACKYSGWSAAYSAYSIMLQLQDFFEESLLVLPESTSVAECGARVASFEANELPGLKLEHMKYHRVRFQVPLVILGSSEHSSLSAGAVVTPTSSSAVTAVIDSSVVEVSEKEKEREVAEDEDGKGWITVAKAAAKQSMSKPAAKTAAGHGRGQVVSAKTSSTVSAPLRSASQVTPTSKNMYNALLQEPSARAVASQSNNNKASIVSSRAGAVAGAVATAVTVTASSTKQAKSRAMNPAVSSGSSTNLAKLLSSLPSNAVVYNHNGPVRAGLGAETAAIVTESMHSSAGLFAKLSNQVIHSILLYCEPEDVARSMATCQLVRGVCIDGHIWRSLLARHYPESTAVPEESHPLAGQCWRQIWLMEANGARYEELRCFFSKKTLAQDVLGVPLKYTVNPKTGLVDYIYSTMELMGQSTYGVGIRKTTWGEDINGFMPLYFTKEHFQRALPRIRESVLRLALQSASSRPSSAPAGGQRSRMPVGRQAPSASQSFHPFMILDVLPRMMNTMIVLLVDGGVDEIEHCLHGYCQVHRLFVALMEEYPILRGEIRRRLRAFVDSPDQRSKSNCANLGELVALVSVSEDLGWMDVVAAITQESFARGVLWLCRDCPDLARLARNGRIMTGENVNPTAICNSSEFPDRLLDEIYMQSGTRHHLFAFHCSFLRLVGCGPRGANMSTIGRLHDLTMGLPPRHMKVRLQHELEKITSLHSSGCGGWDAYFDSICLQRVDTAQLKRMWLTSVRRSFANGYHTLTTDFGRIQSRGVSNILLRGKSFPRVVFCIDTSGSMSSEFVDSATNRRTSRLEYVKEELESIFHSKLSHRNQFSIVQFDHGAHVWSRGLQQATESNLRDATQFVRNWEPDGGTNFVSALEAAFRVQDVQVVYFLSDGEDGNSVGELTQLVKRLSRDGEIQCHTTSFFAPPSGQALLRAMAEAGKGTFVQFGESSGCY